MRTQLVVAAMIFLGAATASADPPEVPTDPATTPDAESGPDPSPSAGPGVIVNPFGPPINTNAAPVDSSARGTPPPVTGLPRVDRLPPTLPPRVTAKNIPDPNDDPGSEDHEDPHYMTALILGGIVIVIPSIYYWSTQGDQSVDWTLKWNKHDWYRKIVSFDAVRWDTNQFHVNTVRHPLVGILQYQIGRANGLGFWGSTAIAAFLGAYWEYFVEYKENPSLNDMMFNTIGGFAIGEPLYQIGQAWRGGSMTTYDRVRSSIFSPFDVVHDLIHHQPDWRRPRYSHRAIFAAGFDAHRLTDASVRHETVLRVDIDAVNHGNFSRPGARSADIRPGAWSRVAAELRFADVNGSESRSDTAFRSSTTYAGHYTQDAEGHGVLAAIGNGFTYDRQRLAGEWDRVAIGHIAGPQVQLSLRRPGLSVRFDAAAYADFGAIQAHAFGADLPFAHDGLLHSTLQSQGYYFGWGGSVTTRLRVDSGNFSFDFEGQRHQLYQINGRDRDSPAELAAQGYDQAAITKQLIPHGTEDSRTYWRTMLGYHVQGRAYTVGLTVDGATRSGSWQDISRTTSQLSVGLLFAMDVDSLRGERLPL